MGEVGGVVLELRCGGGMEVPGLDGMWALENELEVGGTKFVLEVVGVRGVCVSLCRVCVCRHLSCSLSSNLI